MNRLPLAISLLALSVSAAHWVFSTRAQAPAAVTKPPNVDFERHVEPQLDLGKCEGEHAVDDLDDLMKHRFNPILTKISFELYHGQKEVPERLEEVTKHAENLLGCIAQVPRLKQDLDPERTEDFYKLLSAMQGNVLGLHTASSEFNEEASRHWFGHLRQDCSACHIRFNPHQAEAP